MTNAKKIIGLFLLTLIVIVSTLVYTVSAQKNETKDILQQENKTTTAQNVTVSEGTQKSEVTKEDIIIEAQRSLDRSLSILNIVATSMGALVGLITIIVIIAIAIGIFEYSKWKAIRKDIEKEANVIREIRQKAEQDVNTLRDEIEKIPHTPLTEKPSEEVIKKFDEFASRLEFLEALGGSLKPEDYINRGVDLYYKSKYELALKAFEKAIELKSDNYFAWFMKCTTLFFLRRVDEALKAIEKAIGLKPEEVGAWIIKGALLATDGISRYDEALKAFEKAI